MRSYPEKGYSNPFSPRPHFSKKPIFFIVEKNKFWPSISRSTNNPEKFVLQDFYGTKK